MTHNYKQNFYRSFTKTYYKLLLYDWFELILFLQKKWLSHVYIVISKIVETKKPSEAFGGLLGFRVFIEW